MNGIIHGIGSIAVMLLVIIGLVAAYGPLKELLMSGLG